uniref:plant cystathionine gamma-synthase n=1 Tax=Chromera velia CCMP2878 TaxID=1169474 RepID=A0A0G4GE71_9ALVE|eukprot:Cvel_645.t1-p1 / transcript=Cvel_645.t1 / gene=Cvel_645 / organism=Chromera_velia_CCMP2878 / gene_product=Cystathionine beta-lyase, putative / transcript_product=Cystathionine beta-lyase, putative / location=Cvel_scaffold19:199851-201649(+) / protein_length=402 / sequence_SO=supercontig / SO=protein_coding / is_pseudo=false
MNGKSLVAGDWFPGEMGFETKAVHAAVDPDPLTGAILPPIYQNTTFVQTSVADYLAKGFSYSRTANPTVRVLEKKIAELEGGFDCACFSTGMAATCTVFSGFLSPGDHCVITNCSYGGTNRAARVHYSKYNIDFEFVDFRNLKEIEAAIKPGKTKMLFSETPCNPTLFLADVAAISALAKKHGLIHVCDSTFATPLMTKPLELGADMVIQSTTKFYDGHNLTVGGAVISATTQLDETIKFHRNVLGNIMAPQNAFYTLATVKTLPLRVKQQSETALKVAEMLEKHPKVDKVAYPGLASFPQRELALKQHLKGVHGGMLWFEVKGGTAAGRKLMDTIPRPWSLCENLGATESIITCPAVFTHANMTSEDRLKVGITDGFIRVSVGVESAEDLIASLKYALDHI